MEVARVNDLVRGVVLHAGEKIDAFELRCAEKGQSHC
jgi:hypothetical protein